MASVVKSFALAGVDAYPVEVEIDLLGGLPAVSIVGLVDPAVREARERVQAALHFAGCRFPGEKVVINLAPGDIKKSGAHFDLPVAVGLLLRTGQLAIEEQYVKDFAFAAELSLNATLRPCPGVLPMAMAAREAGISRLIVAPENLREASGRRTGVYAFTDLADIISFLAGRNRPPAARRRQRRTATTGAAWIFRMCARTPAEYIASPPPRAQYTHARCAGLRQVDGARRISPSCRA